MPVSYGSLSFAEQIAFLLRKQHVPTTRWTDLAREGHDAGFMVAGAAKAGLLADLHSAVLANAAEGVTLEEFTAKFEEIVQRRGWTGWTGETTAAGRAWRARVIYETNLFSSYNAGRYAQASAVAADRPNARYRHSDGVLHPRELHESWDGKILRFDDPWWRTHWPQNGWGCQCYVDMLSESQLRRLGKSGPDQAPDDGTYEWTDPATGEVRKIPNGIDPNWDYAPGATVKDQIRDAVSRKVPDLPTSLAQALSDDLPPLGIGWRRAFPSAKAVGKKAKAAGVDPDLLQDRHALEGVVGYAKALGNKAVLQDIEDGGIRGSAVLAHELAEIESLRRAGIDFDTPVGQAKLLEAFRRSKEEFLPKLIPWHLDGLRAEINYTRKRLAAQGIAATEAEVARALYHGIDRRWEDALVWELNEMGITWTKAFRQDLVDALQTDS